MWLGENWCWSLLGLKELTDTLIKSLPFLGSLSTPNSAYFAENGNLSLPVLSTVRVRKIKRNGPLLSHLYCGVLLHNVLLDRWLDFQSLQLTEEPPEDEEEDPFTAKLMSFEVRLQLLTCRIVGLLNSSVHVERISKLGLGEKNLFHSSLAFRGLVSQKVS